MKVRVAWLLPLLLPLAACSSDDGLSEPLFFEEPETAVTYEIVLDGMPSETSQELAEQSLAVYRQQEAGAASPAFLRRRAESDRDILQKILRAEGHFRAEVDIAVEEGKTETDPAVVIITVSPGPAFTLKRHDLTLTRADDRAPVLDAAALGSPVGRAAEAAPILEAENEARTRLIRNGFPYAETGNRRAVADLETATLEIETPFDPGPFSTYGPTVYEGLEDVCARYLTTYRPWQQGEVFNAERLRDFQQGLISTDLFATVTVAPPETPPEDGENLPVTVKAEERPFRTIGAGARYNTDKGPSATATFEHRNLFCENETISVRAIAGLELQELAIGYREPQYLRPGQDLIGGLTLKHEEDDAFDELSATATLGIQRRVSKRWVLGVGGLLEASEINDDTGDSTAFLGGVPTFAEYDRTDDPLDPTKGERLRVDVTPFAGTFDDEFATFLVADATGSLYYDITGEKRYVLAGRARLGSIVTDDITTVPPTRRLYSGGGGSVRGYAQRFIGPLDANNDPTGGLSVVELGGEVRARLYGDFGGVLFVEAGSVSEESVPTFNDGVQVAAGVGLRYYSPAGPIRVDVGVPLNGRDADDAFQFYFSIGQAF